VVGDIPPERSLKPADILAYGANTVDDLVKALGAQVGSGRGRDDDGPVVLLNGRRISSYAEISRLPTEAIERLEVLPEAVALKYGYHADQKVLNVVVYERFSSRIAQASATVPSEGGQSAKGGAASYLNIRGDTRLNVDARYDRSSDLLEAARAVWELGDDDALGRFRTLLPATQHLTLTGTIAGPVLKDVPASLNGVFEHLTSRSLLGLGDAGALTSDREARHAHVGGTIGGGIGKWRWSSTGNYDRTSTATLTDTSISGPARNAARSIDARAGADILGSGPLVTLPAGPIYASVKTSFDSTDFSTRSLNGGLVRSASLSRNRGAVQANLDIPIASRDISGVAWVGSLTVSGNVLAEHLSDVGELTTYGFGLAWSPSSRVNLRASITDEQGAPTVQQLGDPLIATPGLIAFDPATRETVQVTQITGGNRSLRLDRRHVFSAGLTAKPLATADVTIGIDYVGTRIDDAIASFPVLTPAIETAFADRLTRTPDGRLTFIDARPVNFARTQQRQLRSVFSFSHVVGTVPPGFENGGIRLDKGDADMRETSPGRFALIPRPGSALERNLDTVNSRVFFNIEHLWRLTDEVQIGANDAPLDLLDGDALSVSGGRSRHEVEVQTGMARRGLGASLNVTWRSGTLVRGLGTTGDLAFHGYATFDLNVFANFGSYLGGKAPTWAKGIRASLTITNLFNQRPEVRDESGATPLNYQSAYLDPLGRTIGFSLRKSF
jgi:hypothetical protein